HWDMPQPLEDAGGWPARDTAGRFADYAALVAGAFGGEVEMWVTLNEPWCASWLGYAKGEAAPGRQDVGRAAAATPQPPRPASQHEDDLAAARLADGNLNRLFLDPVLRGEYPADMLAHYAGR